MLFSLKERGQGFAEFTGALLLLFVLFCLVYTILQMNFFPSWTPIYKLFG